MSIDFKDAYYIPLNLQYRKYLRFHIQGQSYQFKALPFGLSTAPMEFTTVVKEVKLMAQIKGIRIHQCLNNICHIQIPSYLSPGYTDPSGSLSGTKVDNEYRQIRMGT